MSAEFITTRAVSPTRHHHGGDASIDLDDNNHHKPHHHQHPTLSSISTSSSTSSSSTTTSTSPLIPSSLPIRNNNNTLGSYTSNEPRTIHGDHNHNDDDHLDAAEEYSSSIPSPPLKNINRCTRLNYDTTMIPTYIHQIEKYIQTILDRYMFFGVTPTLTYSIVQHTQKNHHAQRQSNEYLFILEQENSTLGHVASGHTVGTTTTTTLSPFKYLKNKKKRKSNQYENVCIEFTLSLNGFVFSESHPFHLQLLDHFAVLFNPNASSTSSSSHENNDLTHSGMNDDASSSSSSGGGNSHENLLNNVHSNHHHHHSQQQQVNTSSHSSIQLFKSSGGDDDDLDASVFGEYGMYRLDVGTASHHHYLSSYYSSNPLNSLDYQCISKYVQKCMILLNLLNNALIDLEMSSSTLHGGGTRHHSTTALNSSTSSVNNHGTTNSSIGHSPPPHPTSQSLPDHHGTGSSSSSSSNTFSRTTTTSSRKFSQDYKFTVRRAGVHVYKWNLRENNNTHTPMEPQHEASSSSATNRLSSKLIAMHQASQQRSSLNPQQSQPQQQQTSPRSLILSYRSCLSPSRIIPFLLRLTKTHVKRYLKYKHVMNTSFGLSTIKQPYYDDLKNWIFEHFIFFKYTQYYPFVLFCDILRSYMLGNITAKKICKIKTNVKELKKQEMKQEKPKRSRMITFRRKTPPSSQPSSQPSSFSQTIRSSNASDQKNDETSSSTSTSRESTDVRTPQEEYSILLKIIEMAQKNYLIYSGSLSQDQLDWKESTLVRNCNQLVHLLCKLDGSIYSGNLAETSEYGHTNTLTTTGTTGSTGTTHMNIHHESPSNANSTTTAMTSSTTTTTLIEPIVQSSFNIFFVLFLKQMDLSMHSHENDPFTHQQEVMTPKIQKRIIHSNATMNSSRNNTTHTSIDTTINTTTSTNTTNLTNSTTLTTKNSTTTTTTITNTTTSNKNSNTMNEYARMDEYHIQSQTLERKHIETLFQYEHEMICRFIDHKCYSQQHWSQQIFRGFTSNSMKLFERNEHVLFDAIRICNVPLIKMLISKFEQVFGSERIMYFINHENDNCITPLHLLHILYGRVIKTNVHCQEIISYLEKKGARRNESFVMVMRPVSGSSGSVHGVHGVHGNSSGSGGVSDDHHSNPGQESTLKNHHDHQHDHHATSSYYRARHTTTTTVLPSHHRWNRVQHQQHQHQQHQDGSLNHHHVSSTIMNNTSNHHPHTTNRHTEGGKMSHSYNTIISKSNLIMTTRTTTTATATTTIPTTTTNNNHRTSTATATTTLTLTSLEVPTRMKFLLSTLESLDMDIWIHILSYRAFSMRTINSLCAVSTEILKNFIQCESIWQRVCYHYFTKHNVNSSLLPQLGKIERMLQDDHLSWRYITKCWTQPSYFKIFALDPKNRMEHAQLLENNSFLKKPQRGDHSTIKSSHALEPQQQQPLGVSEPTSSDFLRVSTSSTTSTTSILSDYNNQQLLYYYERDSFQVEMHDFYMLMDVMNREASISIPKQEVMEHFRQKYGTSKLAKTGILSNYSIYCKRLNVENLFTASAALSKLTLSQQKWIFNFIECIRYYFEKKKEFLIKTDREDMLCYEITLTNNFVEEEQQRTNGVVLLVFNTVTNWIGCFEC